MKWDINWAQFLVRLDHSTQSFIGRMLLLVVWSWFQKQMDWTDFLNCSYLWDENFVLDRNDISGAQVTYTIKSIELGQRATTIHTFYVCDVFDKIQVSKRDSSIQVAHWMMRLCYMECECQRHWYSQELPFLCCKCISNLCQSWKPAPSSLPTIN